MLIDTVEGRVLTSVAEWATIVIDRKDAEIAELTDKFCSERTRMQNELNAYHFLVDAIHDRCRTQGCISMDSLEVMMENLLDNIGDEI